MKRLAAAAAITCSVLLIGASSDDPRQLLRRAADAWDRGDYVAALTIYRDLLDSPAAERVLEPIALQTGELFHTTELTHDGGAPSFSPDGRLIAYEAGTGAVRTTRIVAADPVKQFAPIATLPGHAASFSPDGTKVVYLKLASPSSDIADLQALADRGSGLARAQFVNQLAEVVGRAARLMVRDLATGNDVEIDTGDVRKSSPIAGIDGLILFVGWAAEGAPDQIYVVRQGAAPVALTTDPTDKTILEVNSAGTAVLFGPRRRGAASGFGVVTLPDAKVTNIRGMAPSFSADGRSVTYVSRTEDEYALNIAAIHALDSASVLRRGPEPLDAPAFSADSAAILFQMMPREDWEIFVHQRQGSRESRVTREIQHDVLPRFLTPSRFLASIGESRHRCSHIYEWPSLERKRLFHNNTVRTIAPEYDWVPNREGNKVLIVAERDGNTVSPERGVYLVDLSTRVTVADVRARVAANLASEQALRSTGTRIYAPIADDVRKVVAAASAGQVFEYEKALFDFDSKHITRPGNRLAAEYLFETYKSFGYEPTYQWFSPRGALGGQSANVLATLRGTVNPELVYVVSSHYDSVADGPGADDDSSGTAALLEAARILKDHPQPATIIFASFTGEESGLLGSREFVRRAQTDRMNIVGALNNDMIGWANDHRLDATIRYANHGLRDIQHAAAMQFTNLITYDALYYKNTDAAAYYEVYGDIVSGIGSYPILGNPHYHEPHDVLETINHQQVCEVARATAATIMLLASSPSRLKGLEAGPLRNGVTTLRWTPSPEKGVTGYLVAWGPADTPEAQQTKVATPTATVKGVSPGMVVSVKAVNARGLEGWDWARVTIR